jgi:hypothetical protein
VNDFSNIHFVFVNTPRFCDHPNVHHLDRIVDLDEKNDFISTCDAMIHAQSLGETFGIAIGEFSVNNKPIITYGGPVWNDHYKNILKDQAIYFYNQDDLYKILSEFRKEDYEMKDNNAYKEYNPKDVMQIFKKIFID